ncbi:hypothetical protein [Pseudonocardia sp. H11422]|uniref:hypothetical protein n=1 Tax=Pseudonocardia sp. H11422 TaxID=2835866 RepID=UPI001BDCDD78|nr:hypothetical protein [Pseudonocardia sp. H11422]
MSPTVLRPQSVAAGARRDDGASAAASVTRILVADLERFWPSRRGHAFDEFCR